MKYEKKAAISIVNSMTDYENKIFLTTKNLYEVARCSGWNDIKHSEFCRNLSEVIGDIKNSACSISDYASHLKKKIQELE